MGDIALLGWGMMFGSWLTSLWVMRDRPSPPDVCRKIVDGLYAKVRDGRRFAPDATISVEQVITINGENFRFAIEPATPPENTKENARGHD